MFTGIIEETGKIEAVKHGSKSCELLISANKIFDDLKIGDSVAVNGICLTVTSIAPPLFCADVMAETMRRTNIGVLSKGSSVNLERAMQLNGRFGGHIVSGHIDGTGTVINMRREDNAVWVSISAEPKILKYIIEKGSVTLDGISLTVADVQKDKFSVSIIPHTGQETTLLSKTTGDKINIECDIVGKYIEKLTQQENSGITVEMLSQYGF